MATERLSMRQTREILSLRISTGAVRTTVLRARAAGLDWAQVDTLSDDVPARAGLRTADPAHASSRRPGLRLPARRAAQARRHPRAAPSGISRAASGRVSLHPVLRGLPPLAPAP